MEQQPADWIVADDEHTDVPHCWMWGEISWVAARYSLWLHYCPNWLKWLTSAQWRRDVATWEAEEAEEPEGD
jgi:hypothetical protein